jgi:hypothetical protein
LRDRQKKVERLERSVQEFHQVMRELRFATGIDNFFAEREVWRAENDDPRAGRQRSVHPTEQEMSLSEYLQQQLPAMPLRTDRRLLYVFRHLDTVRRFLTSEIDRLPDEVKASLLEQLYNPLKDIRQYYAEQERKLGQLPIDRKSSAARANVSGILRSVRRLGRGAKR